MVWLATLSSLDLSEGKPRSSVRETFASTRTRSMQMLPPRTRAIVDELLEEDTKTHEQLYLADSRDAVVPVRFFAMVPTNDSKVHRVPLRYLPTSARFGQDVLIEATTTLYLQVVQEGLTPWHIDRLDGEGQFPVLDGRYSYTNDGSSITVVVIDSGIRSTHTAFGDRVVGEYGMTTEGDNSTEDCIGHGTHVAGIIGGAWTGVAKKVNLLAIRVFDCNGQADSSVVIQALEWICIDVESSPVAAPAVINLSFSGMKSLAVNSAVADCVSAGYVVVVAAGNEQSSACNFSPASEGSAITVAALSPSTDISTETRASFSNFGSCVDLHAPGVNVISASNQGDAEYSVLSGTSMAAPVVSGLAAMVLDDNPTLTPQQVRDLLIGTCITSTRVRSPFIDVSGLIAAGPGEVYIPSSSTLLTPSYPLLLLLLLFIILLN